jgi:hypothetical protein
MKKGRVMVALVLALSLVLAIGIVSASVFPNSCHCYAACYYCPVGGGNCSIWDGGGACFCLNNPCRLNTHFICCAQSK